MSELRLYVYGVHLFFGYKWVLDTSTLMKLSQYAMALTGLRFMAWHGISVSASKSGVSPPGPAILHKTQEALCPADDIPGMICHHNRENKDKIIIRV